MNLSFNLTNFFTVGIMALVFFAMFSFAKEKITKKDEQK